MGKRATIFWLFAYFVALACLSLAYLKDEKEIKRQGKKILSIESSITELAKREYKPEWRKFEYLDKADYVMELWLTENSAIIWRTGQALEDRKYIFVYDVPFCVYNWERDHMMACPFKIEK